MQHHVFDDKTVNTLVYQPETGCELACPGCYSLCTYNNPNNLLRSYFHDRAETTHRGMKKIICAEEGFEFKANQFILSMNHFTEQLTIEDDAVEAYTFANWILKKAVANENFNEVELTIPWVTINRYINAFDTHSNVQLNVSIDSHKLGHHEPNAHSMQDKIIQLSKKFGKVCAYVTCYENTNYMEVINYLTPYVGGEGTTIDSLYLIVPKLPPSVMLKNKKDNIRNEVLVNKLKRIASKNENVILDACVEHAEGDSPCSAGINVFSVTPQGIMSCLYQTAPTEINETGTFKDCKSETDVYNALLNYVKDSRDLLKKPLSENKTTCPMKALLQKDSSALLDVDF